MNKKIKNSLKDSYTISDKYIVARERNENWKKELK